jgi:hypothetical protein
MNIAILAWGALIWYKGTLKIRSRWRFDGPSLPIEFARIFDDGLLTLVIQEGNPEVGTYWALSGYETLHAAIENVRVQEDDPPTEWIHCLLSNGEVYRGDGATRVVSDTVRQKVGAWLARNPVFDAAIWTGLQPNWEAMRNGRPFSSEDAVRYLEELQEAADREPSNQEAQRRLQTAREYVCKAPSQVQTEVRRRVRDRLGWRDIILPAELFEPTFMEPAWTDLAKKLIVPARPSGLWTRTNIFVTGPGLLKFEATGRWSYSSRFTFGSLFSPDGDLLAPMPLKRCLSESAPIGSLIGKIGGSIADRGESVFLIGSYCVREIGEDQKGPLYLTINDLIDGYSDNYGEIEVAIQIAYTPTPPSAGASAGKSK